jgi:phenylalanyl-tRNA synthetase beta chain
LQYRLEAVGLNPINNIVDVTNYVLAELPQPMHAFDLDTLSGGTITVRRSNAGETIIGLNKENYVLDDQALVIADAAGPIAVAGVIGGLASGVTEKTTRIVLESANFHAGSVRKTSSRLKLRTDASMRFEKALDPSNTLRGLARAMALLEIVSPGIRLVGGLVDNSGPRKEHAPIEMTLDWLRGKLGRAVEAAEVRSILEALEFGVVETAGVFSVTVPSWRATKDVSLKEDLVEEVGRMIGYDNITPASPLLPVAPPPANPLRDFLHELREGCVAQGFTEVSNYSFVNAAQLTELGIPSGDCLRVLNPISADQGLLRNSLLPGLVKNVRDNLRHLDSFRFFEIGCEIHPKSGGLPDEVFHLGAVVCSRAGDGEAGLMEAKRLAECLLPGAETRPVDPRVTDHPMRSWAVDWHSARVGTIAELHPSIVEGRAAVLDLDLGAIQERIASPIRYKQLPRFPSSSFDLTVITPLRTLVGEIAAILRDPVEGFETAVAYLGEYVKEQKSISFRVTVQADHTMSQDEISAVRLGIIERVRARGFGLTV